MNASKGRQKQFAAVTPAHKLKHEILNPYKQPSIAFKRRSIDEPPNGVYNAPSGGFGASDWLAAQYRRGQNIGPDSKQEGTQ